jgi:hypothetical protein
MTYPVPFDNWTRNNPPRIALYGLFKEENGKIKGFIERSHTTEWSEERVRQFTLKNALYNLQNYRGKKHNSNVFLYRLTRTNGPIQVDWESHTKACLNGCKSLEGRNPKFSICSVQSNTIP